jgi:hypothetical protein
MQNVFYFRNDGPLGVPASLVSDDLLPKIEDFYTPMLPHISQSVTASEISIVNHSTKVPIGVFSWPTITGGGNTSQMLPPGTAALLLLRTHVNRTFGRKFFPPGGEDDNTGAQVAAGMLSAMASAGAVVIGSFLGAGSGNSWLPGIPAKGAHYWAFEEVVARADWAYQRRRRPGRGI